ncbi:MAG: hypothetical protein AMJ55_04925 [Gammaproteobacteria bacterium SG8_15]|nr:MAG: hypothetical protein AMJ55_04925 [Gammaproteobacteria bacterium SG8_15]
MKYGKAHAVRVSQQVAGVAVTKSFWLILSILFALASHNVGAAVLPADRADVLYHSYDGGGVEVTGPSVLVRKSIGDSFSGSLNYYIDNVSSASIDVLSSGASPYEEERTEKSVNLDYLHDKTIMSLSYTNSEESDYIADTFSFNISQDMFGDLTTVTLGYSQGDNTIGKNYQGQPDPNFTEQNSTTRSYRVGVSQVITKDSLLTGVFESIADEGYLQNPYRSARYCVPPLTDPVPPPNCTGDAFEPENYPNTRSSNAIAIRGRYYLPYRASIFGGYRYYNDSWGIRGNTVELGYVHPFKTAWLAEINYRYYTQTKADFYQDIFPYPDSQNFLARDKELSTFDSNSVGFGISYDFATAGWKYIDRGSLNFYYNYIYFDYKDFRNALVDAPPQEQPLYNFSANVLRLFVSIWY